MEIVGVDWRCVDYPTFTRLGTALIALWPAAAGSATTGVYFRIRVSKMQIAENIVKAASDKKLDRGEVWKLLDREFHKEEAG
jgi:hypothetical protein